MEQGDRSDVLVSSERHFGITSVALRLALAGIAAVSAASPVAADRGRRPPRMHANLAAMLADDDVVTAALPSSTLRAEVGADLRRPAPDTQTIPPPPSIVRRGQVNITAPLLVNDRLIGEIDVRADAAGDGDIDAARLLDLLGRLLDPALRASLVERIGGRPRVPLGTLSIEPMVIVYDPATLEVRVVLPASRMPPQSVSFRGYDAPDPKRFSPQAAYAGGVAVGATQRFVESGPNRGRAPLLLSTDGFLTLGKFPGVTVQSGGLIEERPGSRYSFERAQTRIMYDSFSNAVHSVAGEFSPALSGFQGGARMLGIGISRDYAGIRPFENIRPSGRGGITLERPSTVIVEVNGIETRRLQLDAGRYQLTDLSSASGANDVRLFVQDDLGRREVASTAFFTASAMLAPGLTDFGFAAGKRESVRTEYGGPFTATGYVRRGIGGNLTIGAGAQYAAGDWQALGETVVGTPVGLFRVQGSGSHVAGRGGYAVSVDWLHSFDAAGATWNFTVLSSLYSRNFASPFDRLGRLNDQQWRIDARADWRRGAIGVTGTASLARTRSRSEEQRVDLTGYYNYGRMSLTGTAGIERRGVGSWGPRALIGISYQLGSRSTASVRADTRRGAVVAEFGRYPIDEVDDLSGRLQLVRESDRIGLAGDARYFGNRMIASVEKSQFYAQRASAIATKETVVRASTFIGIADGSIAIGRPVRGSFAIYDRHKSLEGAKVVVRDEGGFVIARQDWLGAPLAPFNRAFSPVYHSYDVDPLPTGYDLGEGRLAAFPGAFSGYRVPVGSDESRVAIGYLIGSGGPVTNMSGTVDRIGDPKFEPRAFFTNAAGRFAVDRLGPGTYRVLIGTTEVARFAIASKSEGMVDVGKLDAKGQ